MDKETQLQIIKLLGFEFVEIQEVEDTNEKVEKYVNKTHRLFYWSNQDKWSIKNLITTKSTFAYSFEYIMSVYFKNIDYDVDEYKSKLFEEDKEMLINYNLI